MHEQTIFMSERGVDRTGKGGGQRHISVGGVYKTLKTGVMVKNVVYLLSLCATLRKTHGANFTTVIHTANKSMN